MRIVGILLCCAILVSGQTPGDGQTTKPPPETTTEVPTTTPPKTTPSTPKTTTVTPAPAPAPPKTTPRPITPYPHNNGKWSVDIDNSSCIMLNGAIEIILNVQNKSVSLSIPSTANATGTCGDNQTITLTWDSEITNEQNTLTLSFESNHGAKTDADGISAGKFGLQNVTAILYLNGSDTETIDNSVNRTLVNLGVFQAPLNHSYSCLSEEVVKPKAGVENGLTLKIREMQLEAYRATAPGHHEFNAAIQCPADDATDVVPIAVGAALAGLVVIVLVAYLIGRRRSRARGYQSV